MLEEGGGVSFCFLTLSLCLCPWLGRFVAFVLRGGSCREIVAICFGGSVEIVMLSGKCFSRSGYMSWLPMLLSLTKFW